MRYIKYCKTEHNLKLGCPTVHLGTFQYYRELDPSFSIADEDEGRIAYLCQPTDESPLYLTPEQWNMISGGAVTITRQGQSGPPRWPGPVDFSMSGGNMEFLDSGKIKYHGNLSVVHTYPNAYIFCITVLSDDESIPEPSSIHKDYDSYYEIKPESMSQFIALLGSLLHSSLAYQDIQFKHLPQEASLSIPSQLTHVKWDHREVDYVDEKINILKTPDDFEQQSLQSRFQDVIFEKDKKYSGDSEYRIVYSVQHPQLGILSTRKDPKILTINQMSELLT